MKATKWPMSGQTKHAKAYGSSDMSEVYYGGEGIVQRPEYHDLKGEALQLRALQATEILEDVFERSAPLETANTELFTSDDCQVVGRELLLQYPVFDKNSDDRLVFDVAKNDVYMVEGTSTSYEKDVVIQRTQYRSGTVMEEYFASFERKIPHLEGAFFTTYLFEFMTNGAVRATVASKNIDADDGVEGATYERPMTSYDFREFCKEVSEVADHINVGHAEQDIDRKLAEHIQ